MIAALNHRIGEFRSAQEIPCARSFRIARHFDVRRVRLGPGNCVRAGDRDRAKARAEHLRRPRGDQRVLGGDHRETGHCGPDGHRQVRPEPECHRLFGRPYVFHQPLHPRHRPAGPPDHDRPGRRRLRGRRLPRPPGGPELEPREHRARRSAARAAGHPVRAQFHRWRDQHHHAPAGRRGRRPGLPDRRLARAPERRFLHEHGYSRTSLRCP